MVSKKTFIFWGTIALLVIFFIEFFWVVLYAPQKTTATPTPEQPQAFDGSAVANARVVSFFNQGLAFCNSTVPVQQAFFSSVSGVSNPLQFSETLTAFTLNESLADSALAQLRVGLEEKCGGDYRLLRSAVLRFTDANLTFRSSTAMSETKILPTSVFARGIKGTVDASASVNDSVKLLVVAKFLGDSLEAEPQVEQLLLPTPSPSPSPEVSVEVITANTSNSSNASNSS